MQIRHKLLGFSIIAIPQLLLVGYLLMVRGLYYATVDDILMQDIIRGAFLKGGWDAVYISPVFCVPTAWLYQLVPAVGWVGVIYIVVETLSMLVIDFGLAQRAVGVWETILYCVASFICWYQMWWHFTFTTVAYSAVIAGIVLLLFGSVSISNKYVRILSGVCLLIVGGLIRRDTLVGAAVVLFPIATYRGIKCRERRFLIVLGTLLVMYVVIGIQDTAIRNTSAVEKEYTEWNKAREAIGDYLDVEDVIATGIWSEDETKCFYEQIQLDKDVYSTETEIEIEKKVNAQKTMSDRVKETVYRFGACIKTMMHLRRYENIYVLLMGVLGFFIFVFYKDRRCDACMAVAGFFLTVAVFAYINRSLYRILMPGGVLAVLLLLFFIPDGKKMLHKLLPAFFCFCVMIIMVHSHLPYVRDRESQFDPANNEAITYFADHQDQLFLPAQSEAYGIANCVPAIEAPEYDVANLLGNWNIYSEGYFAVADSYGIGDPDHLVRGIPGSDTIRLVARTEDGVPDYFMQFISEHSGKEDVHAELEDSFYTVWMGEWGVYRVR